MLSPVGNCLQYASGVSTDRLPGIGVEEANEEERHVVFPWDTTKRRQVYDCCKIFISVGSVRDKELVWINSVMDIPATVDIGE